MSLLDQRREHAPDDLKPESQAASRSESLAAVAFPAGAAAFVSVALMTDLAHGALSAAIVITAAVVALRTFGRRLRLESQSWLLIAGASALIGLVAGMGATVHDAGGSVAGTAANVALCWAAVGLISAHMRAGDPTASPSMSRKALVTLTATAAICLCLVSILLPVGDPPAVAASAAPAALALFFALSARGRGVTDDIAIGVRALAAGSIAALLALTTPHRGSVVAMAVATLLPCAATLAVVLRRRAPSVSPWMLITGALLASVAAGAATGPIALVALITVLAGYGPTLRRRSIADEVDAVVVDPSLDSGPDIRMRRLVTGLTAVAVGLRLLAGRGLWLDEATSVHQARLPFMAMLQNIYTDDNHPPLHHILLWLDIRLVGDSELALRLPSVVFGALLVPMLFITGRALFGRRVGAIAAAVGAVAPIAVWYGQEARMYSQFMLLSLVSVYALIRILRTGEKRFWTLFTLSSVALIYTQYFAVLHVGATLLVVVIEVVRRHRALRSAHARTGGEWGYAVGQTSVASLARRLGVSLIAQAILLAPLVPWIIHQAVRNQQEGFGFSTTGLAGGSDVVPVPGIYGLLTNVQWAIFGYQNDQLTQRLVALWPIGLLLVLFLLGRQRRMANRYLLLIAGLPVLVVFAASFVAAKSRSLAEVRYFAGAVPVLFILLAAGLATVVTSRSAQYVAIGGLLASMLIAVGLQETSTDNPRLYQYREAVEQIRSTAEAGDVVAYAPFYMNYVLEYYEPGVPSMRATDELPATAGRVFLLEAKSFAGSTQSDQEIEGALAKLRKRGMEVEARYDFAQVTVLEVG
jgi:Dolichyl-phosphate-mannose-protein mannosyltransferase